jgi:AcrR family transcriptional regulator
MGQPADDVDADGAGGGWERRRAVMRRDIESAALTLCAKVGYEAATAEDIAAASGISVRTFYRYFQAKDDVLLAMPLRVLENLCVAVESRPAGEPLLTSWRIVMTTGQHWDVRDLELTRRSWEIMARSPAVANLMGRHPMFTQRLTALSTSRLGEGTDPLRAEVAASAIQGALLAALAAWRVDGDAATLPAIFGRALDALAEICRVD